MGNIIQIKRGAGKPNNGILANGELGYDTENNRLYIGVEEGAPIDVAGTKLDIYDTGKEVGGTQYPSLDLNTYTTPGLYVCTSGNAAKSTNSPIKNSGFKLVVINGYNNSHLN